MNKQLADAFESLDRLQAGDLRSRIQDLEAKARGLSAASVGSVLETEGVDAATLLAALELKRAVGQINVTIHAVGILLTLPYILEPGEIVEYVSLGAGNTGREFDLETDRRVCEFKFIAWKGGAEAIRQNGIFKDFFYLAEHPTLKRKQLFVVDDFHPLRFLNGGRALSSVTKEKRIALDFASRYGEEYVRVRDYYTPRHHLVEIVDLARLVPGLFGALCDVAEPSAVD